MHVSLSLTYEVFESLFFSKILYTYRKNWPKEFCYCRDMIEN